MLLEDQEYFANNLYSTDRHHSFIKKLEQNIGASIDFRIAEMPIFINNSLRKKLENYAKEIIIECIDLHSDSRYNNHIPELYKVPHQSSKPLFLLLILQLLKMQMANTFLKLSNYRVFHHYLDISIFMQIQYCRNIHLLIIIAPTYLIIQMKNIFHY